MTTDTLKEALRGIRVVELSGGLASEHCGHALAGLGAIVLAVRPPPIEQASPKPPSLDAKKQIIEIDITTTEGYERLVALTADCDVFIEDRGPLGWICGEPLSPLLLQRNPRLLAICLSPFGMAGPHSQYAAYPLNCYHSGGNAQQIPCDPLRPQDKTRAPLQAGGRWGEAKAGTLAAVAALANLLDGNRGNRTNSAGGAIIDCSKQEALISYNWTEVARYANEGRSPTRLAPLATIVGGILPAAGGHVEIAVREDHQWQALAALLEHPEWIDDPRFANRAARTSRWEEVSRTLATETCKFAALDLQLRGRELGIPIAAVLSPAELLADADLAARGAWEHISGTEMKLPRWDTSVSRPTRPPESQAVYTTGSTHANGKPGKPLQGKRVLDFGWVAMGPYAGYVLASLGAEVIHIARPQKDHVPGVDLFRYNYGFDSLNTGKTWVGVDLKRREGIELVHALASRSDIVLDNFRPGVTERLGISFRELSAINPRLVMLSASTYGRRNIGGPYVGYAPVFAALAGLAHLTGYPDGPPAEVSHPVDFYAGSVGVLGILAGLHQLATTGSGCHIDLSAREAVLWSLSHDMAQFQMGLDDRRLGNSHRDMSPHGVYRCKGENRWISIAVGSGAEWERFVSCIGHSALAADPRYRTMQGRLEYREQLDLAIEQWTQDRDMEDLYQRLQACGVAAFPSCTSEDLCKDAHLKARDAFQSRVTEHGTRWFLAPPWQQVGALRHQLQTIDGEGAIDTVFSGLLGLTPERIESLKSNGVIAAR